MTRPRRINPASEAKARALEAAARATRSFAVQLYESGEDNMAMHIYNVVAPVAG